ncbi:hypothetical protein ACHAWF_001536 [Thalassiosira exigua]
MIMSTTVLTAVFVSLFLSFNTWITIHHHVLKDDSASRNLRYNSATVERQQQYLDAPRVTTIDESISSASSSSSSPYGYFVPGGEATALPSIRLNPEEEADLQDHRFYGGAGDKTHLGGFTEFDPQGVSPTLWKHMVEYLGIKSLLDVGCGRGISTSWFITHGLEYVVCAEGSHDAIEKSIIPHIKHVPNRTRYEIVEHDFSRGSWWWWPSRTVMMPVEIGNRGILNLMFHPPPLLFCFHCRHDQFTEHVGRNFQPNYITAWRKAALIFMTHSRYGGWHHIEVHKPSWWVTKMESLGFVFDGTLTEQMKKMAMKDKSRRDLTKSLNKTGASVGQHIWGTLLVFHNPLVASRYEHAHLFAEVRSYLFHSSPIKTIQLRARKHFKLFQYAVCP